MNYYVSESGLTVLRRKVDDDTYQIYPDYHFNNRVVIWREATVNLKILFKRKRSIPGYKWIDIEAEGSMAEVYRNAVPVISVQARDESISYYDGSQYMPLRPKDTYCPALSNFASENIDTTLADWQKSFHSLISIKMPVDSYYTIKAAAMARLTFLISRAAKFDPLEPEAQFWCLEASHGGYRYADNTFRGSCYEYDISSFYPWLMVTEKFPCGKPVWKTTDSIEKLGVYRFTDARGRSYYDVCSIDDGVDDDDYSDHSDIVRGASNRIPNFSSVKRLAKDGKPNALVWDHYIDGKTLFGSYVEPLYKLKQQGHNIAKRYLNIVTGALAEKKWQPAEDIATEKHIDSRAGLKDIAEAVSYNAIFKLPHLAHIHCFLTAYGRMKMRDIRRKYGDAVKYMHTDGFLSTKEITYDAIGKGELGELKLIGFDRYAVHSSRKFKWIEKDGTDYYESKTQRFDSDWVATKLEHARS